MSTWTKWTPFPDPRKKKYLVAPFGPGVYELRLKGKDKLVLVGYGSCCAQRMSSLLPPPWGRGTRNNTEKRNFVLKHLSSIEYRTCACATKAEAQSLEKKRMAEEEYSYPT